MEAKFRKAIEEYQCPGCVVGGDISCFESNDTGGVGCGKHVAGTVVFPVVGSIFLGMPKGFNRLGEFTKLKPNIYATFESSDWKYDMWNIPVWKYLSKEGHTFVRGIMPRRNEPFVHIFLENCMDNINCHEISRADVDGTD
jgi:hypothetical protein